MNLFDIIGSILSADEDAFDIISFDTPNGHYFIIIGPAIVEEGFYGFIVKSTENEVLSGDDPDSALLFRTDTMAEAHETAEVFKELFEKFPPAGITSPDGNFYKFKT